VLEFPHFVVSYSSLIKGCYVPGAFKDCKKGRQRSYILLPTTGSDYIDQCTRANMQIAKRIMVFCTVDIISLLSGIYITPPLIASLEGLYNCSNNSCAMLLQFLCKNK